jgi:hypothetical protein
VNGHDARHLCHRKIRGANAGIQEDIDSPRGDAAGDGELKAQKKVDEFDFRRAI